MLHPLSRRIWSLVAFATLVVTLLPFSAEAQRRAAPRRPRVNPPIVRPSVVIVRGISFPRYVHYHPWYGYAPAWGPYSGYYPYGPHYAGLASAVRVDVTPSDAQVFVDGYFAGEVDEFDNPFQSLRLEPGGHEIAVYREGYRTLRREIYARPGVVEGIRAEMQPLGPGETSELPEPADGRPAEIDRPAPRRPDSQLTPAPARFGTLLMRVQPGDAEILVDGELWEAAEGQEATALRLPEGRHRVEIRREGFARYVEDVLIRRGATLRLNVSLKN